MTTTEKTNSARIMLASMMDEEEGKTLDSDGSTEDEGEEGDVVGRKKK
jgi:hypothetical protein